VTAPASATSRTRWLIGAAVLVFVCLACGLLVSAFGALYFFTADRISETAPPGELLSGAGPTPTLFAEELEIPIEGFQHAPDGAEITYEHYPPSSGTHYRFAAAWGVYDEPVSEGMFVHNLEHGGIVILYNCPADCSELEQQLRDFYANAPPEDQFNQVKILITPYERELPTPIVALAWGHQLNLNRFDEARLLEWYLRFVNQGPELVP
jgi:hypothetical protein